MSSIQRRADNATELRLDDEDISAGRLVIVIRGLQTTVSDSFIPADGGPAPPAAPRSEGSVRHEAPVSPLIEEVDAIYSATRYAPVLGTSLVLAAWRGQEARAAELIAATIEDASAENECRAIALAEYARAVLCNGLGR